MSALFLLIAVFLLNLEGNTWGNSTAFMGFLILFPAAFFLLKLAKFRPNKTSSWIMGFAGILGLAYTAYGIVDSKIKSRAELLHDGSIDFYPPDIGYQMFALIVCCYLVYVASRSTLGGRGGATKLLD